MKCTLIVAFAVSVMFLPVMLQAQSQPRITKPIDTKSLTRVPSSTHPLANPQNDRGRVDANLPMERMMLVMKPSEEQRATMQALINRQNDPDSASYHQWLAPEVFGAKFGPSDEDIAKVVGWLHQQGLRVNAVGRGKQFIEFSGTAGQVENTFRTEIHHYSLNGEDHVANAFDISLPQALAEVVGGVLSLHNFPRYANHAKSFRVHRDPTTNQLVPDFTLSTTNGSAHFVAPGDFARIYNTKPLLEKKINGSGVSIAIVGRSNVELSDIQTFRKIFGLPANDPIFIVNGQDPGILFGGEEAEADLDLEWSGAAAPGATIKFVVSASTFSADGSDLSKVYIVDNMVAPIMSASFSNCELALGTAGNQFFHNLYEQAAAEGITVFSSTGDDGAAGCYPQVFPVAAARQDVSGLASTPFNVAVGGTQFAENGLDGVFWNANNRADLSSAVGYIPERIWNESCDPTKDPDNCFDTNLFFLVAGSGGQSSCIKSQLVNNEFVCEGGYPKPSWQAGIGVPNDGVRDIPDLSLDAGAGHDGYLLCTEGSCQTIESNGQTILETAAVVGGTSVSTPEMAGIMALIEQKNGKFQGLANFNFYKLAAQENLANCNSSKQTDPTHPADCSFHDVTAGNNGVPDVPGYPATKGYDMASGLGSVNAEQVVLGWPTAQKLPSATTVSTNSISAQHGQPIPLTVQVAAKSGGGEPSGEVDFIADNFGSVLGGPLYGGKMSRNIANLPGGSYTMHAQYSGDAMFSKSDSGSVSVNISPEDSVVHATAWEINLAGFPHIVFGPLLYGQPTAFDIRVAGASGLGTATGHVTIADGAATLGTFPLAEGGNAFVEVDGLPPKTGMAVGKHSFAISYSGDNSYKPSVSRTFDLWVEKKTPITLMTPVPSTVTAGAPVQLQLLVGGAGLALPPGVELPSGTVQVFDNGQAISRKIPVVFNGLQGPGASQAVFTTSSLAAGLHTLSLQYSGDSNYNPVTDFPFLIPATVTVNPPAGTIPKISMEQSPATVRLGDSVNYLVTVRPPSKGLTPNGKVSLVSLNGEVLAGPTNLSDGNATLLLTFAVAGEFSVAASYSGDKNYSSFSTAAQTTTVNLGIPKVRLNAAASPVDAGVQTSLAVTVVGAPNNPIIGQNLPSGTVRFLDSVDGGPPVPLGKVGVLTLGNGGDSVFTLPIVLPRGTNVITARYDGDNNWTSKDSNEVTVVVQ